MKHLNAISGWTESRRLDNLNPIGPLVIYVYRRWTRMDTQNATLDSVETQVIRVYIENVA